MPPLLLLKDFEPHVGTIFVCLSDKNERVELELIKAVACPTNREIKEGMRAPFSLIFKGVFSERPVQRMYALEHAVMGTVDAFLVPIGQVEDGSFEMEAIFG